MDIAQLTFTLEAKDEISLPEYKGSTFHGGFGHALLHVSPRVARQFFDLSLRPTSNTPNPYLLLPPLDERSTYKKGELFTLSITLIGKTVQNAPIILSAIDYFGEEMGLGAQSTKFRILNLTHVHPQLIASSANVDEIQLHFLTRMRLKKGGKLCRLAPNFSIFADNLMQRVENLDSAYGESQPRLKASKDLHQAARKIRSQNAQTKWDDWSRYSGRQKEWMKFGGLTGQISYKGDLTPFSDFLQLGQWLHLGGKTSFGLGKYEIRNG